MDNKVIKNGNFPSELKEEKSSVYAIEGIKIEKDKLSSENLKLEIEECDYQGEDNILLWVKNEENFDRPRPILSFTEQKFQSFHDEMEKTEDFGSELDFSTTQINIENQCYDDDDGENQCSTSEQDDESDMDIVTSDMSESSDTEFSDTEGEPRELGGGWKLLTHASADVRPRPEPPLMRDYAEVNPAVGFSRTMTALECFEHFVSDDIIQHIIACVNDRAKVFFEANPQKKGIVNSIYWRDITERDLFTFLALYFYTGVCILPDMNMYWSRKCFEPGVHFFTASIMSRDRYLSIMKFLRFSKVMEVKKNVPSTRLNSFCKLLTDISKNRVDAGAHIAIGEALVLLKGSLGFRQFVKNRRTRFGIKLFVMCNSEQKWSGYNYDFRVHNGKDAQNPLYLPKIAGIKELAKSEQIVVHFVSHLLGQGRHIVVDNCYASYRLARFLESQNTLMTATVHTNRGVPKELLDKQLEKHRAAFIRKDSSLIVKYNKKKSIYVISTKYAADFVEKRNKVCFGGARNVFKKPKAVEMYNTYMRGLEKADQLLEPVDPNCKSLAWFKKLGLHLLMRMLLNSFIVYKNIAHPKVVFKQYIITIVRDLLEKYNSGMAAIQEKFIASNPRAGRKRKPEEAIHAWIPLERLPGSANAKPRKRCRVCAPKRVQTRKCCSGCIEKPGLCSIEHFKEWHNQNPSN